MQKIFLQNHMKDFKVEAACEYINYVSKLVRSKDHLVIHVHDMEGSDGDADPEVRKSLPEIDVDPKDLQVQKLYSNAFWKTDLEQVLRDHEVGFVIVSGFAAEQCVTFTLNGAAERDFPAVLLQHGIVSSKPAAIDAIYRDRQVVSYSVIEFMMNAIN
jgi:nicotinamidase-related amidase